MNGKIKEAFHKIHAEEALKEKTKAFLAQETQGYTQRKPYKTKSFQYLLSAAACLVLLLVGSYWLYFVPTTEISIDINPSVELGVNRFDKVISVNGYNKDGQELADSLSVKFTDYGEAIRQILENKSIIRLLSQNEVLTIAVVGSNGSQSERILSHIESCTAGQKNTYCYAAHLDEVGTAHKMGLSCGKYHAFLELQALDPSITVEEIENMTMREIRDLTEELSASRNSTSQTDSNESSGHNGMGKGCQHRHRYGGQSQP